MHDQLLTLPDDVPVLPDPRCRLASVRLRRPIGGGRPSATSAAPTPCSPRPTRTPSSPRSLGGLGTYPPYFHDLREVNRHGPTLLGMPQPALPALELDARSAGCSTDGAAGRSTSDRSPPGLPATSRGRWPSRCGRSSHRGWAGSSTATRRSCSSSAPTRTAPSSCASATRSATTTSSVSWPAASTAWAAAGLPTGPHSLVEAGRGRGPACSTCASVPSIRGRPRPRGRPTSSSAISPTSARSSSAPVDAVMCGHGERAGTAASILEAAATHGVAVVGRRARRLGRRHTLAARVDRDHAGCHGRRRHARRRCAWGCGPTSPSSACWSRVNALVGGTIGQERIVLPLLAEREFGLTAYTAALTFIVAFGITKALTNLVAGALVRPRRPQARPRRRLARRHPRAAPADLGAVVGLGRGRQRPPRHQSGPHLVDHRHHEDRPRRARPARPRHGAQRSRRLRRRRRHRRATGWIATNHGLRPEPFLLGAAYVALGLGLSTLVVHETRGHARLRGRRPPRRRPAPSLTIGQVLVRHDVRAIATCSPSTRPASSTTSTTGWPGGFSPSCSPPTASRSATIGLLAALYPAVWGVGQLVTGALSDRIGRKPLIVAGMLIQAAALAALRRGTGLARLGRRGRGARRRHRDGLPHPARGRSATSPTPAGGPPPSASTGCGATAATPSGPSSPASPPTSSACAAPSPLSPRSPSPAGSSPRGSSPRPARRHDLLPALRWRQLRPG